MSSVLSDFHFGPRFEVAVLSRVGTGAQTRLENQDNFVVIDVDGCACHMLDQVPHRLTLPDWPAGHGRIAVLDGMGGHGHGREAAEAVAAGLLAVPACTGGAELARHLDALHARLQRQFPESDGLARPGTTLTLLELPPGTAPLLYHVGDSRLYELGRERALPLTVDHVPATVAAMAGRIGEGDWRRQVHGQHAPQISQAFILGNAFAHPARLDDPLYELTPARLPSWLGHLADRRALTLHPDCAYLLATDGFWSCAHPDAFVRRWPGLFAHCADAAAMVESLFAALDREPPPGLQPDNLTALVLRPVARHPDETALPLDAAQVPQGKI